MEELSQVQFVVSEPFVLGEALPFATDPAVREEMIVLKLWMRGNGIEEFEGGDENHVCVRLSDGYRIQHWLRSRGIKRPEYWIQNR